MANSGCNLDASATTSNTSDDPSTSIGSNHCCGVSDEEAYATVATSAPKRRAGRKKFRETRHPIFKGVRRKNGEKWVCEVREPSKNSRIWLGTFPTAEMAARAHDVAAIALRGRKACLNFADSAWRLPLPASSSAKDIQKAAAEAAEAFRPSQETKNTCNDVDNTELKDLAVSPAENFLCMDDEAAGLSVEGFLASMAEGVLFSPPPCLESQFHWDDVEAEVDASLWSFSI